jgi:hypothetical protein
VGCSSTSSATDATATASRSTFVVKVVRSLRAYVTASGTSNTRRTSAVSDR